MRRVGELKAQAPIRTSWVLVMLVLKGWVGGKGGILTEWPFMYFVTEWTTMSAPWSRGFWM